MTARIALVTSLSALFATGCLVVDSGEGAPTQPTSDEHKNGEPESEDLNLDLNETGCVPTGVADTHAMCICEDFQQVGHINVRPGPGGQAATLAVNGRTDVVAAMELDGGLIAHGGLHIVSGTSDIAGDLVTNQLVSFVGNLSVGGDLVAGHGVDGVGRLSVDGALRSGASATVVGPMDYGSELPYPGDQAAPCACPNSNAFDVALAVADAKQLNDNASAGLSEEGLPNIGGATIELPAGRYYLQSIDSVGDLRFRITGGVALFVDGDIQAVGSEHFQIEPGGALDLYVAGSVQTVGNVSFGDADDGGSFRLLIGGEDSVLLSVGAQQFHGSLYAPGATLEYAGATSVYGSLLVRNIEGVGSLVVEYSGAVETPEDTCLTEQEIPR